MSRAPDPAWIEAAAWCHRACLWLYPAAIRDRHGEEMQQAFRDRCREVAAGRHGFTRVLLFELLPDTLGSAAISQFDLGVGDMHRRLVLGLAALAASFGLLLFQDAYSAKVLHWAFKAKSVYQNSQAAREMKAEQKRVHLLADQLAAEPSAASRVQAAFLYRGLYDASLNPPFYTMDEDGQWHIPDAPQLVADGKLATAALGASAGSDAGWVAAAAVLSCLPEAGCDRAAAIRHLTTLEPDNAYGWSLAFKQAALANDEPAMQAAISRAGAAHYYDEHAGELRRALHASALSLLPDDAEARAAIARRVAEGRFIGTADFHADLRVQCARREPGQQPPQRWVESHPSSEGDCLRVARLMTSSASPFSAMRGWAILAANDGSPATAARSEQARRQFWASNSGIGATPVGDDRHWLPWTDAQWNDWAQATANGG